LPRNAILAAPLFEDEEHLFEPWSDAFKVEITVASHQFKSTFFPKLTFCDARGEFVSSPLPNNGSSCVCGLIKHPSCKETLLPCSSLITATPEDRRRVFQWLYRNKSVLLVWKRCVPQMPKDLVKKLHALVNEEE
jgi:hypothetical protein